jgi:hypothetical protein
MEGSYNLVNPPSHHFHRESQILKTEGNLSIHDRGDDLLIRVLKDHADSLTDLQKVTRLSRF